MIDINMGIWDCGWGKIPIPIYIILNIIIKY